MTRQARRERLEILELVPDAVGGRAHGEVSLEIHPTLPRSLRRPAGRQALPCKSIMLDLTAHREALGER